MAARILVVNDTQEILDLFQMLLEYEGYEVVLSSFPFKHTGEIEKIMVSDLPSEQVWPSNVSSCPQT